MKSDEGLLCGRLLLRCPALLPRDGLEGNGTGKVARCLLRVASYGRGLKGGDLLRGNKKGAGDYDDGEHQHQQPDEFQDSFHEASFERRTLVPHDGHEPNMLCEVRARENVAERPSMGQPERDSSAASFHGNLAMSQRLEHGDRLIAVAQSSAGRMAWATTPCFMKSWTILSNGARLFVMNI